MGMFDEVYCFAALPDGRDPRGTCFQTKSFPDPCMCRYRITSTGRLIDSAGNDLEPDGYITFYIADRENEDSEAPARTSKLREYRARFLSAQLQNITPVDEDGDDGICYGLASFRWFKPRSFLFGDPDEESDTSKDDMGLEK
jgi:uncharacterized protein YnzC (UPF0291/DUF896 family)